MNATHHLSSFDQNIPSICFLYQGPSQVQLERRTLWLKRTLESSGLDILRVPSKANALRLPHAASAGALRFRKASLTEELKEPGGQPAAQEADPTCDSAHRALHEVASVPSHVSSEAVADQVDIPKRKIVLFLREVTKVCE